jgi:hypothetical protein
LADGILCVEWAVESTSSNVRDVGSVVIDAWYHRIRV